MIVGGITLEQVDRIYQRMGVKELFILPWYDGPHLVGLITGAIEQIDGYEGQSAFLEHFIVLPEARNPLRILQRMPALAARLLRARGIGRIVLCIDNDHPKRRGLDAWARRCHYTKYAEQYDKSWYVTYLTPQEPPTDGQEQTEDPSAAADAGPGTAAASTPAAASAASAASGTPGRAD